MGKSKLKLKTFYIILLLICPVVIGLNNAHADVDNFYFSDFTGDYYLSKDDKGISHLKVIESVTAVFPNYDQNKGICRQIAYTNKGSKNVTLPRLTKDDITLTRNGSPEPIYSIEKENDYYNVCTGTDDYLRGEQTYTFEYEFEKVVTEYDGYQELYWDTNGTGSAQRFDKVTARVHFEDENVFTGNYWCYVGKYGFNDSYRCTTNEITDGVEFTAEQLMSYENLTFDIELKPGSFTVPEPDKNYTYVWLTVGVGVIALVIIVWMIIKFANSRDKAHYYKGLFVKPEYQPHDKYTLPEMAEIYLGKKKDMKVGMLLELVVKKKIEFKKQDKRKWSIIVKDLNSVRSEYITLLTILNGGTKPEVGDEINLERHTATSSLVKLGKEMDDKIKNDLYNAGLTEKDYKIGGSQKRGIANIVAMSIVFIPVIISLCFMAQGIVNSLLSLEYTYGQEMVFYEHYYFTIFMIIVITVPIVVAFSDAIQRYQDHTNKGLEASNYMEGLKLYIQMAEADRMKMLQSVEGADTSPEGIVKLYEKLLPYAAIFGLEESWMKEMKEYCEVEEIEEPDYLMQGIVASNMIRAASTASSYATTATRMSSSGGGSSSGFSGGGGGGFSGGGGGGGGFGGR